MSALPLKLARVEWLKMSRRFGFWMGILLFAGVFAIGFIADYMQHRRATGTLRETSQWSNAVEIAGTIGTMIMLVLVILLAASEKTWRTERQNVIDGLSRNQYFGAKLVMVAMIAVLFWLIAVFYGGVFSVLERGLLASPENAFLRTVDAQLLGGVLLALFTVGCMALLFGVISSGSGAAMGLMFLFLILQPIFMMRMARYGGAWREATAYFPTTVLGSLVNEDMYDTVKFNQHIERMRSMPVNMPLPLPAWKAVWAAMAYASLSSFGAWLSIRRRDL